MDEVEATRGRGGLNRITSRRAGLLRPYGVERCAAAGEVLVRQGDTDREMYLVRSGRVEISRDIGGRRVVLGEIGPGDFFGEMALLESEPRSADAIALEDTTLLVIGPGMLLMRIRNDPTLAVEMLQRLSGRVRSLHARLADGFGDDDAREFDGL
jgi:CRP-like cAMP-binding protein